MLNTNIKTTIMLIMLLFASPTLANTNTKDNNEVQCMAQNIYFEAGNQSTKGMIAVSNVVMNRVGDSRFSKTPCGVIQQRRGRRCQFSWVCNRHRIKDKSLYQKATTIAEQVYHGEHRDITHGAKFYHAKYVRPRWSVVFNKTTRIGDHIFYRG